MENFILVRDRSIKTQMRIMKTFGEGKKSCGVSRIAM